MLAKLYFLLYNIIMKLEGYERRPGMVDKPAGLLLLSDVTEKEFIKKAAPPLKKVI